MFQSVLDKYPLWVVSATCWAIEVPEPITEPVPDVITIPSVPTSVRFPIVKEDCLLLKVVQSEEDKAPLLETDAVGKLNTWEPLPALTIAKSVPEVPTDKVWAEVGSEFIEVTAADIPVLEIVILEPLGVIVMPVPATRVSAPVRLLRLDTPPPVTGYLE